MDTAIPRRTRTYQNHHMDSTRWDRFNPRDDDIVIATSYKSGTTWMQMIVRHLLFENTDGLPSVMRMSPWIDSRFQLTVDEMVSTVESQEHRRFVKSHLPLDGLTYFPQVKYIVVGRDARDVFMSLWNHYSNYTPGFYERINNLPGLVGGPCPVCPEDIREFWSGWMSRGWFEWESEGYPLWSNLWHTKTWWEYRDLPNILFVHYNDLLNDSKGEIKRIADFLGIQITDEALQAVVNAVTFANVKANADQLVPEVAQAFEGGAQTFINKGTNGRWKPVLTAGDLELYEAAVERVLSPDCAKWLEHGRLT